jgi:drug/metabolite transporter (DMT)-like permease
MSQISEIRHGRALILAIASAIATGSGGPMAKALFEGGWSPIGVAFARAALATLVLVVPAVIMLRGKRRTVWDSRHGVVAIGVLGVAGLVICYFNARTPDP